MVGTLGGVVAAGTSFGVPFRSAGALSGVPAPITPAAAALTGVGGLSATAIEQLPAALAGSGALAATTSQLYPEPAALTGGDGVGGLSATAYQYAQSAASPTGAGALSATATIVSVQPGLLTGAGALAGSGFPGYIRAAGLAGGDGVGGLVATGAPIITAPAALLAGAGTLAGVPAPILGAAPNLAGDGALAAGYSQIQNSAPGLTGNGALSAAAVVPAVAYDSVGAGATGEHSGGSGSWSYTHTIGASANALLVLFDLWAGSIPSTMTLKIGTTTISQLASLPTFSSPQGYPDSFYAFGILNPPTGAQTIQLSCSGIGGDGISYATVNSVAYRNVTGFGTPVTHTGSGTTASVSSVSSATGQMVVCGFTCDSFSGSFSAFNQTQRYNVAFVNSVNFAMVLGDAAGAASVSFSATQPSSNFAGIAVPVL